MVNPVVLDILNEVVPAPAKSFIISLLAIKDVIPIPVNASPEEYEVAIPAPSCALVTVIEVAVGNPPIFSNSFDGDNRYPPFVNPDIVLTKIVVSTSVAGTESNTETPDVG